MLPAICGVESQALCPETPCGTSLCEHCGCHRKDESSPRARELLTIFRL